MGDTVMAMQDADLERIGKYVQSQLPRWLEAVERPLPEARILERLTRVEDAIVSGQELMRTEFRAQRELMEQRFAAVDRRFDSMQKQMDERFEAVDKRFDAVQLQMDQRFAAADARFEAILREMDKRFDAVEKRFEAVDRRFEEQREQTNKRFEAVDKRFEEQREQTNKRFESVDKRFDDVQANFARTQWLIGVGFVVLGTMVSIFHFLG